MVLPLLPVEELACKHLQNDAPLQGKADSSLVPEPDTASEGNSQPAAASVTSPPAQIQPAAAQAIAEVTKAAATSAMANLYQVTIESIPASLKAIPNWVHWNLTPGESGKPTKVPWIAGANKAAATNDPTGWRDFPTAADSLTSEFGLGFVLPDCGQCFFVDLDNVRDPQTSEIKPWAERAIKAVSSYTEISPSGTGVHIIGRVEAPVTAAGLKKGPVEFYTRGRYMTMTGNRLGSSPLELNVVEVSWLRKLIESKVFDFLEGSKYDRLFNNVGEGYTDHYSSQSEADMALCSFLAQRLGPDLESINSAFCLSGMIRPKWSEKRGTSTYGRETILKVLSTDDQLPGELFEDALALRFSNEHSGDLRYVDLWR